MPPQEGSGHLSWPGLVLDSEVLMVSLGSWCLMDRAKASSLDRWVIDAEIGTYQDLFPANSGRTFPSVSCQNKAWLKVISPCGCCVRRRMKEVLFHRPIACMVVAGNDRRTSGQGSWHSLTQTWQCLGCEHCQVACLISLP